MVAQHPSTGAKPVWVVVLGDFGRSPRMQNHATSLSKQAGMQVHVLAYTSTSWSQPSENVLVHSLAPPPAWLGTLPRILGLVLKAIIQAWSLLTNMLLSMPKPSVVMLQVPPAIPVMAICWLACWWHQAALILDWHNFGYTLMGMSMGKRHWLVRQAEGFERFWGRRAAASLCVTKAMQQELGSRWGIRATVFHDHAPSHFRRCTLQERHALLLKLQPLFATPMHPRDFCAAAASANHPPSGGPHALPASDADWLLVSRDTSPDKMHPWGERPGAQQASTSGIQQQIHGHSQHQQHGIRPTAIDLDLAADDPAADIKHADVSVGRGSSGASGGGENARQTQSPDAASLGSHSRDVGSAQESWQGDAGRDTRNQPAAHLGTPETTGNAATLDRPPERARHQNGRPGAPADLEATVCTCVEPGESAQQRPGAPALLVSSTSWTIDEDFQILLDAATIYDQQACRHLSWLPELVIIVTGKGPQKAMYEQRMRQLDLQHVAFRTAWLEPGDYPLLLGCADLGVCLHTSSSGLDLPMKVVDMLGCGLPACAVAYSCINELVQHGANGVLFATAAELAQHWRHLLQGFPHNRDLQKMAENILTGPVCHWQDAWEKIVKPVVEQAAASTAQ
ncbi:hypothetical protein WJX74_002223 [Apatococcus lobatus]|uniref:Chitobiosyldiphosphodolichol beta-mannosyltransferase n=1 Tax=Apatococcus lobatus TaxID=904363 RepID=A0AAW1SEK3_9CHLO